MALGGLFQEGNPMVLSKTEGMWEKGKACRSRTLEWASVPSDATLCPVDR